MTGPAYKRAVELMEADLGDELVALDAERGSCFGFNEVATWVWRRLREPANFDQIRDGLLAEYDVSEKQCTAELQELLDDMAMKGLIEAV